ncbi:YveK family protein [Paenibacillus lignilyticus]|uniref:Lipopolysaccharide biosynthesis protein n=1 Tax=Paenibacillus lignilyticus TaxID=1172615 RepID=A0ABS5C783_9BACL|nr:Wzz/FepE/Etk N-terminal domain-containing protein [Paenibacillus lignilyticus]MBP3961819.1 lipopolysaccharide biosynthesis protein [Paenibacillus lignilyticus]MBP3963510.1 lipopolysaccharide biosynthesis protein [Paenibacillus lignilyticus]
MELQRYWSIVRKKLWLIALMVIVSCTLVGYYTSHFVKPQYEASTKLIVGQSKEADPNKSIIDVGSINSNILLIKTYKEIIRTPRVMEKVVKEHPELGVSAGELASKVSVSSINETQVMTITVRDTSSERAANIANAMSEVFRQEIRTLMKLDNIAVLNLADPTQHRSQVSPNPAMNIMVTFVLALMAGVVAAFILDQLDDTVKTEEDVQAQFGIPVLADIPKIKRSVKGASGHNAQMKQLSGRKSNVSLDA